MRLLVNFRFTNFQLGREEHAGRDLVKNDAMGPSCVSGRFMSWSLGSSLLTSSKVQEATRVAKMHA